MEKIKKYLVIVLCAVALVALLMPYASVVVEVDAFGYSDESATSVSGLTVAFQGYVALILIIGPAALIAANLGIVPVLKRMEEALLIVVPIISFIIALIAYAQASGIAVSSGGGEDYGVYTYAKLGIGAILIIICNIGLLVYGLITNKSVKLNKNIVNNTVKCITDALNSEATAKAETNTAVAPAPETVAEPEQPINEEAPSNEDEYTLG